LRHRAGHRAGDRGRGGQGDRVGLVLLLLDCLPVRLPPGPFPGPGLPLLLLLVRRLRDGGVLVGLVVVVLRLLGLGLAPVAPVAVDPLREIPVALVRVQAVLALAEPALDLRWRILVEEG